MSDEGQTTTVSQVQDASIEPTHEEKVSYGNFANSQYVSIKKETPSVLWHYTNGQSLQSILVSGQLWSTQVSCLNDQTELRYATQLLRTAVEDYAKEHLLSADDKYLYSAIEEQLSDDTVASYWFITCFSAAADDLSQWRAYGGGESGYSIGFHPQELDKHGQRDQAYLVNVSYDPNAHTRIARATAAATFAAYKAGLSRRPGRREEWTNAFLHWWGEIITFLAPVIKHPAFSAEQEWRIVRQLRPNEGTSMRFSQKATLMARHLPLSFCAEGVTPPRLPISAVFVGPARNGRISRVSITDMLVAHQYVDVPVHLSGVPYQSV